jgi:hypothetical protein
MAQGQADALRVFLKKHYASGDAVADKTILYSVAFASLDDKAQQIIMYVNGDDWCGSGGCSALILEPANASFKIRARFSLARLPIRVMPSKTNGWHDLAMPVGNDFVQIRFDGNRYPGNPSMAKHLPHGSEKSGIAIALKQDGQSLFP